MVKKRGLLSRVVAAFVALTLFGGSLGAVTTVYAADLNVRRVSVFQIDGTDVILSRGAQTATPREGQRLASGNVLTTGEDTHLYLQLDGNSLAKMGQTSQMGISTIGQNLTLTIQSGSALIHIGQGVEQDTVTRISNVGLTVRGTMYTASLLPTGDGVFVMLSGLGYVDGYYLYPGYAIVIDEENDLTLVPITMDILDNFTLQAIVTNSEYLLENSDFVTPLFVRQVIEELLSRGEGIADIPPIVGILPTAPYLVAGLPTGPSAEQNIPGVPGTPPQAPSQPTAPDNNDQAPEPPPSNGGTENGDETPPTGTLPDNGETPPIDPGEPDVLPTLPSNRPSGTGTSSDPFRLETLAHFEFLRDNYTYLSAGHHFRVVNYVSLGANVAFPGVFYGVFEGAGEFNPSTISIGAIDTGVEGTAFFQEIGQGATVRNLHFASSIQGFANNGAGLAVINRGTVENVSTAVSLSGGGYVGGIASINYGTITRSFAEGAIYGNGPAAGGIAGRNEGTISVSAFLDGIGSGITNNGAYAGGIAGVNYGIITESFNTASVSGQGPAGGIAGVNNTGLGGITYVFSAGDVSSSNSNAGGIVGQIQGGTPPQTQVQNSLRALGHIAGTNHGQSGIIVGAESQLIGNFALRGIPQDLADNLPTPQYNTLLYNLNFHTLEAAWVSSVWEFSNGWPRLPNFRGDQYSFPIPSLAPITWNWNFILCLCDPCYCYECECYDIPPLFPIIVPPQPPLKDDDEYDYDGYDQKPEDDEDYDDDEYDQKPEEDEKSEEEEEPGEEYDPNDEDSENDNVEADYDNADDTDTDVDNDNTDTGGENTDTDNDDTDTGDEGSGTNEDENNDTNTDDENTSTDDESADTGDENTDTSYPDNPDNPNSDPYDEVELYEEETNE
ncbi:MAG: hypothetical protein FWG63_02600 [Defluviitaleaceae bacterium]|nr:hypothetical protein [Defluviitaleaceae bacterium]